MTIIELSSTLLKSTKNKKGSANMRFENAKEAERSMEWTTLRAFFSTIEDADKNRADKSAKINQAIKRF